MIATITSSKFFWTTLQPAEPPAAQQEDQDPGDAAGDVVEGERA